MDAVAAFDQHAQRRIEVFALIGAVEGIGEQHDLAAIGRADRLGVGLEYIAPPLRQRALALMPANFSNSLRNSGLLLRQLASGAKRDARPA